MHIEALAVVGFEFPFLFGGTFIEGRVVGSLAVAFKYFPSFSEGLSLRAKIYRSRPPLLRQISLPFRRDFH